MHRYGFRLFFASLALLGTSVSLNAGEKAASTKKLKIVILMGQSNMVGYADPHTAWYLTQPVYAPPAKTATVKSSGYNSGQFYWSGLTFARGGSEEYNARGQELLEERKEIIRLWRARVYDNFSRAAIASGKKNEWKTEEWGPPPVDADGQFRRNMPRFLGEKLKDRHVSERMAAHIESSENKLHPRVAVGLIGKRDEPIAEDVTRVRELFLNGTKAEDFDGLDEAIKAVGRITAENRMAYAELLKEHVNLPIAQRTHISALGAVAGQSLGDDRHAMSHGLLTVGYSKLATNSGPEYPFGISYERMVDSPVLLIKCAWGGKSLQSHFRPPSLSTDDNP